MMLKISAIIAVLLLVVFGVVINLKPETTSTQVTQPIASAPIISVQPFEADTDAALIQRVASLEQALAQQSTQNNQLAQRVMELESSLADLSSARANGPQPGNGGFTAMLGNMGGNRGDTQTQLVDAGFDELRAEQIQSEVERIRQLLAASADGNDRGNTNELRAELGKELRQSLGVTDYEKYLEATGQSTSATVRRVEEDSAAAAVGLKEGDKIISYNGQRVYNSSELIVQTQNENITGSVLIEVERDGAIQQMTVPAGTLGVSVGGGRGQFGGPGTGGMPGGRPGN